MSLIQIEFFFLNLYVFIANKSNQFKLFTSINVQILRDNLGGHVISIVILTLFNHTVNNIQNGKKNKFYGNHEYKLTF